MLTKKNCFYLLIISALLFFQFLNCNAKDVQDNFIQLKDNEPQGKISLKKALEIANENNPKVQAIVATLPVAEAKLIIAKYIPNPVIGANTELVKSGSTHPGQLGQTFELGRKRYWRIQIAKGEISKTELEIAKVLWETRAKTHIAYANLSISENLFNLASGRRDFYKSLLEISEKRYQAGSASGLDVDRTNIELLSAENDLDETNKKLKRAKVDFKGILGQKQDTELEVEGPESLKPKIFTKDYKPLKKVIEEATEKRLEAAILEKDFGITRAKLKKARWERVPNLYIEGGPAKPSFRDSVWGPYFGTQFEVPLFNRKQGEIKEAKAQIEYLAKERKRIENEINMEVKGALVDLELSETQIERFESKLLTSSENILEAIKKGYEIGRLTLTDVLNAEQKNRDLRQKYLENLLNYQIALASLEYAVGVPILE
ncbi:MAG: TolC family protein [Candidatus Melainabacteria bacterium]|nr:TolC family protein [Candidatus Melainabacteria bacterium]